MIPTTQSVNGQNGADPLTGSWKLLMGKTTWTVRLAPREGFPGEHLGKGERETRDEAGKVVRMDIGAVKEKGNFRAWLGPGVIKCTGLFHPRNDIEGVCIEMNGDSAGKFHAQRLSASGTLGPTQGK